MEHAAEVRRIVKAVGERDFADRAVALRRIGQITPAAHQPPLPHIMHERGAFAFEQAVEMAKRKVRSGAQSPRRKVFRRDASQSRISPASASAAPTAARPRRADSSAAAIRSTILSATRSCTVLGIVRQQSQANRAASTPPWRRARSCGSTRTRGETFGCADTLRQHRPRDAQHARGEIADEVDGIGPAAVGEHEAAGHELGFAPILVHEPAAGLHDVDVKEAGWIARAPNRWFGSRAAPPSVR